MKNKMLLIVVMAVALLAACSTTTKQQFAQSGQIIGTVADDTLITSNVKAKLLADQSFKSFHIHVTTISGVVTLRGAVSSRQLRDQAATEAASIKGVKAVVDDIVIKPAH